VALTLSRSSARRSMVVGQAFRSRPCGTSRDSAGRFLPASRMHSLMKLSETSLGDEVEIDRAKILRRRLRTLDIVPTKPLITYFDRGCRKGFIRGYPADENTIL
jgi:hypothetical protein